MKKTLFLIPVVAQLPKTRIEASEMWHRGTAFYEESNKSYHVVVSKRNISSVRDTYSRIVVVYAMGTLEV